MPTYGKIGCEGIYNYIKETYVTKSKDGKISKTTSIDLPIGKNFCTLDGVAIVCGPSDNPKMSNCLPMWENKGHFKQHTFTTESNPRQLEYPGMEYCFVEFPATETSSDCPNNETWAVFGFIGNHS